jgi:hypothetical protein
MSRLRRYEILLPRKFNDGRPVPDRVISETLAELEDRFSAVSWETQTIQGAWQQHGVRYRDEMFRVFVDVEDRPEHRQFFLSYKQQLKSRFEQLDIWMTTYLIDVL